MKKFAFFLTLAVFLMIEPFSLKANAENKLVERLPEQELQENKTPEAVAYNFVQAILDKDIEKMLIYTHPEFALEIIKNTGMANCDRSAYMDSLATIFICEDPSILGRDNDIVVLKAREEWGFIEGFDLPEAPSDYQDYEDTFYIVEAGDDIASVIEVEDRVIEIVEDELEVLVNEEEDLCPEFTGLYEKYYRLYEIEGEIPGLTVSMNQVVENGMIYVPEEDTTYPGIKYYRIWFGIVPSSEIGTTSREELWSEYNPAFKMGLMPDSSGNWKITGIKTYE